jgi:hypothetical protein
LLFDEIVLGVWGVTPLPHFFGEDPTVAANLEYLQSLLSNLASNTNASIGNGRGHPPSTGGYRFSLRSQDVYSTDTVYRMDTDKRCDKNKPTPAKDDELDKPSYPNKALWEFIPAYERTAQLTSVMLMAGTIFGFILLYLVGKSGI